MKKSSSPLIVLLSSILFLSSCADNSKRNDEVYSLLSEGLENSTSSINVSTAEVLHKLQDKLNEYTTKDKAEIWLPRAKQITAYTADISTYFEGLQQKENLNNEEANEFYKKLIQFQSNVFAVDSSIKHVFENRLTLITRSFDTTINQADNFYKTFFRNTSHETFIAMLHRFQNNIKIIEAKTISFCNAIVGCLDCGGYSTGFAAIAVAKKNYLKPGEFIEITAGIGGFSMAGGPEFIINRSIVKIDNGTGAAEYKMKVPLKPGNYSVPVKIKLTDQNGIKREFQINVDYTVIKPCDQ